MVLVIGQLLIAAAAYAFLIYCATVVFRNLETQFLTQGRSISCSVPLGAILLLVLLLLELGIYLQIVVAQMDGGTLRALSNGFNMIWPILYGLTLGYVLGCLSAREQARLMFTILALVTLPLFIALWVIAQWRIFMAVT